MSDTEKQQKHLVAQALELLHKEYEANQIFNGYFDGEEPLVIPSPRQDVGLYLYDRSKALYWVDRDAYDDERTAWENDTNQAKHQEAIDIIRNTGSVVPFQDLLDAVERGRVVPFIGAGMSKPVGMPLWGEALLQLLSLLPGADAAAIETLISAGNYLEAAQVLAEYDAVQTSNFIRTTYRAQKLKLAGPMLLLPRFAKGCIVTTNFDDAIEKIYEEQKAGNFEAHMHGTQDHNFFQRLVRGDRCLLKLHGDAENYATHILTKTQYEEAYGDPFDFHKPLPKALRQIYISQSLLFLGCSLDQDWTLELFKKAKEEDAYQIPNHYAILPAPANDQVRQHKASDLLALNIHPLWYPDGQHGYVEKLLQLVVDVIEKRVAFNG
ncbi:SIR2 family protein [Sideroxydans sp. CL21]|uniref:SIR2 family NAD-dependent protein deacylase n=1 Tax=Sideroxydans sp. CL21 TaxID=2600596 RepID=UPI0024BCD505|nr:SIR2 family protein [Sideroxydans sp. CL21]